MSANNDLKTTNRECPRIKHFNFIFLDNSNFPIVSHCDPPPRLRVNRARPPIFVVPPAALSEYARFENPDHKNTDSGETIRGRGRGGRMRCRYESTFRRAVKCVRCRRARCTRNDKFGLDDCPRCINVSRGRRRERPKRDRS